METHVVTCTSTRSAFFSSVTKSNTEDVALEFRQYISFVALVIIGMISDLHLGGKRMSRLVTAKWPKYPKRLFSSVSKSNIQI